MRLRAPKRWTSRLAAAGLLVLAATGAARAQLLPADFFATLPEPGKAAQVEADTLAYDQLNDVISAEGRVSLHYSGYSITCDDLRYEQGNGALVCDGNVEIRDPAGNVYRAERLTVTKGMKTAVLKALQLTTSTGALVSADDVEFRKELGTTLIEAAYSPCGLCVDKKGHRIGWQVKAGKIVQDQANRTVSLDNPRLELLGIPVAWLPVLRVPDLSAAGEAGLQVPSLDYKPELGGRAVVPFFWAAGRHTDLIFTPTLMTRQGVLFGGQWVQRFGAGALSVRAWGLRQAAPEAFSGKLGDRAWRGAFRASGEFSVAPDWRAVFGYTAFTDAAFLGDYSLDSGGASVNEVHAVHLSRDTRIDLRVEDYTRLGEVSAATQKSEADVLPNMRGVTETDLGEMGRLRFSATLQNIHRENDETATYGGKNYVPGYEGDKLHATVEASWQKQLISPQGIVATPFLGLRLDGARYDRGSLSTPGEPAGEVLLSATPIAAIDVRYPLMMTGPDASTILFEPIGQLVYRASSRTSPGITNDNAQSFVLDDTNIFSYNRFSGTDRQETGLRANLGFRTLATLGADRWVEFIAGQSVQLAGENSFAAPDQMHLEARSEMAGKTSPLVLAARGSPGGGLTLGAKAQLELIDGMAGIGRVAAGAHWAENGYALGGDVVHLRHDDDAGVTADQTEVTVSAGAPLPVDYWRVDGSVSWDVAANKWLQSTANLVYDDGYLMITGFATATGSTNSNPDKVVLGAKLRLKGPDGGVSF